MSLTPVFLDFETYWSSTHSLSKMSAIEYVMHPETEIQSCSIKVGLEGKAQTFFGYDDIEDALLTLVPWDNAWVIAHNNSEFDAMVLRWRFNLNPKLWGCTLAMARPIHSKDIGLSLNKLAYKYSDRRKGDLEQINTKGKKVADFTTSERAAMEVYNDLDTEICADIFKKLLPKTPPAEIRIIDMTIRMLVDPQFHVDVDLLERGLKAERVRKQKVLKEIGNLLDPLADMTMADVQAELKSPKKFRQLLEELNVAIPMKESPSTGKRIPALAKNDEGFLALREHENPLVSAAVEARLDTQSSILETRMDRFIKVANMCGGKMPIALRYYGADTTGRWSGTMKLNQQNLPRVNPSRAKISDVLRKALVAPKGYKVVVADLSGIELRVNMFLWKVPYAMELFRNDPENADLYKVFAADLYDCKIGQVDKQQRQVGKVAHLGLGFGAGFVTFKTVAKLMGGVDIDEDESRKIVYKYRDKHHQVATAWKRCHAALDFISSGSEFTIDPWEMCKTSKEGIVTPKGVIRYPDLRLETDPESKQPEWVYGHGRSKARIYAGKVTENIVQHLARNVIADNALSIARTPLGKKYPVAHMVHDELIYIVKDEDAQAMLDLIQETMRTPPDWWPELVTWSEGDIAQTYGEAK